MLLALGCLLGCAELHPLTLQGNHPLKPDKADPYGMQADARAIGFAVVLGDGASFSRRAVRMHRVDAGATR